MRKNLEMMLYNKILKKINIKYTIWNFPLRKQNLQKEYLYLDLVKGEPKRKEKR